MQCTVKPLKGDAPPSASEVTANDCLHKLVRAAGLYELPDRDAARQRAVVEIDKLVRETIAYLATQKSLTTDAIARAGGRLLTFGSYRLGAHDMHTDLDALVLAPSHVSREDWFTTFPIVASSHPCISAMHAKPDAYVPVITLQWDDSASTNAGSSGVVDLIEVDILFARLAVPIVPPSLSLLDPNCVRLFGAGMGDGAAGDIKSILSINGVRANEAILSMLKSFGPNTTTEFTLALRVVKCWARNRGVYGNAFGYLGGVNLALLMTQVAGFYPQATAIRMLERFFAIYSVWRWPKPVKLTALVHPPGLNQPQWEPAVTLPSASATPVAVSTADAGVSTASSSSLMPILTPVYPVINSAHNVNPSSLRVMKHELKRGAAIMARTSIAAAGSMLGVLSASTPLQSAGSGSTFAAVADPLVSASGSALSTASSDGDIACLHALLRPADFTCRYQHYLAITVSASSDVAVSSMGDGDSSAWRSWVESRLRQLPLMLESGAAASGSPLLRAHLHPIPWVPTLAGATAYGSTTTFQHSQLWHPGHIPLALYLVGLWLESPSASADASGDDADGSGRVSVNASTHTTEPVHLHLPQHLDLQPACSAWARDVVGSYDRLSVFAALSASGVSTLPLDVHVAPLSPAASHVSVEQVLTDNYLTSALRSNWSAGQKQ